MNFIVGFPRTRRQHELIWVIMDRVIKYAHFIPVKVPIRGEYVKMYLREMVRLHEVPLSIICTQFTYKFWKSFQKGLVKVKLSTTFHSQTDWKCSVQFRIYKTCWWLMWLILRVTRMTICHWLSLLIVTVITRVSIWLHLSLFIVKGVDLL